MTHCAVCENEGTSGVLHLCTRGPCPTCAAHFAELDRETGEGTRLLKLEMVANMQIQERLERALQRNRELLVKQAALAEMGLRAGLEAVREFVARVNAAAEAEMLRTGNITGAHHRAIESELKKLNP